MDTQHTTAKQTSTTDTLNDTLTGPKPPTLIGTTIIPYSDRDIKLRNQGLQLIELSASENCNEEIHYKGFKNYPKLENAVMDSSNMIIEVSIIAHCCRYFLGEAELIGDTLNLIYIPYGPFCSCHCCYTLCYEFWMNELNDNVNFPKYVTINGSEVIGKIEFRQRHNEITND